MKITGKAWVYGDNINTDYIIPGRYMELTGPEEIGEHVFEEHDPEFREKVQLGDIVVGGHNFGGGSSREHAPIALKQVGVGCVIAESFARIFYRNSINIGLPALECLGITGIVKKMDVLTVNVSEGTIINISKNAALNFNPLPDFMLEVLKSGGLAPFLNKNKEW
jgi:3-isopropylmalate/(R)-2-methylmalate dehydratase small subunit